MITAFDDRNFAVVALILLHEVRHPLVWASIALGLSGVVRLSLAGRSLRQGDLLRASVQPAALCRLGAGFCFALTIVLIKLSIQAMSGPSIMVRALLALVVTNSLQTLMQGAWREPHELRRGFTTWRSSCGAGTSSAAGSAWWFAAFALADVALVRAVG